MSADERRPGMGSQQIEDRPPSPGVGDSGFAAGTDAGGGERVWEREPFVAGGWEVVGTRGGEREAARRRVEANPSVMPPHPMPVDRVGEKHRSEQMFLRLAVPVALGGLVLGGLMSRLWSGRRTGRGEGAVVALRVRGRRGARDARRIAELLHGQRLRGEILFE